MCATHLYVCISNLFVEPEHRAGHSDVSKADPLSHQEGTGVQVVVQHSEGPLHTLLGLLCTLHRPRKETLLQRTNYIIYIQSSTIRYRARHSKVNYNQHELQTCLLNCMIPRVGNTHVLAEGMISESAKLTHCRTWAAAWGVAPRRASLLTVIERFKKSCIKN